MNNNMKYRKKIGIEGKSDKYREERRIGRGVYGEEKRKRERGECGGEAKK